MDDRRPPSSTESVPARPLEWFDDDAFWRDLFPYMFPAKRFDDAADQVDKVLALTRPPAATALDLCCGPGRCSVALARRGYAVTGVDRTTFLLDHARRRAEDAGVAVEWVISDMRDFVRPDAFGLVLSMFTSFGYFDDKQQDVAVLANMVRSLLPGGACLVDVNGKERLARILMPTTSERFDDGTLLVQRHAIFDDWTRIRNEWILVRDGQAKHYRFHHTLYSAQELRDRMVSVGFTDIRCYGSLDGEPYGPEAERLIVVGRKAEE